MEGIQDDRAQQLLSSCYSNMNDVSGESQALPRVGPEYQVEIPSLVEECCHIHIAPGSSEITENLEDSLLGLPIPVMWSRVEVENINGIVEFENSEECQITSNNEHTGPRVETAEPLSIPRHDRDVLSDNQLACGGEIASFDSVQESKNKIDQVDGVLCPLPDSLGASWEDSECDSFLLGLYFFGKNLGVVKRFVGSKEMGDVLSFYYGRFYGSKRYQRWADCRKLRSRRNISGPKIFSGSRQQELLSRLFAQVSPECQGILVQATREFGEGKITLEEYIFTLKSAVGVSMLVQAVGIGRGKQDLTVTSVEPTKSSNLISMRPEIPIGKACSSLTSEEIIKFLTGGYRLSKARSSDLFWEAVWPRLLAGGWHSEQPKDSISGSKNSLVFLIPGVRKFSRRKLVKGNHYFDSVTDVLSKVASDPGLLELENVGANGSEKEECGSDLNLRRENNHSSNMQQHCYLQPPYLSSNHHVQKFMIVDTSMAHGTVRPKVRELKSLPVRNFGASTLSSFSGESEQDTSDESLEEEEFNTGHCACLEELATTGTSLKSSEGLNNRLDESMSNALDLSAGFVDNHRNQITGLFSKKQPRKAMKYQSSGKAKPGCSKYMVPRTRPQLFAGGCIADSTRITKDVSAECKLYEDDSPCTSTSHRACEDAAVKPPPNLSPASCLAKESAERREGIDFFDLRSHDIVNENCPGTEEPPEKAQSPKLIDLNVPDHSADSGADRPSVDDMSQKNDVPCIDPSVCVSETSQKPEQLKLPDAMTPAEQQSSTNSRRQSTRNRPLTMKALEALELGFLGSTKKRKSEDVQEGKSKIKSTRRARVNSDVKENPTRGSRKDFSDSRIGEYPNGLHSRLDMVSESQV